MYLSMHFAKTLALRLAALCAVALVYLMPAAATAQTVTQYSEATAGAINSATTCTAPLVRNFTVGTSFTISDVDLGMLATHSWRGDIQVTLQSPAGTRVQIVSGDSTNVSGDNFNVRLNNAGTQVVNTDGFTTNHTTTAPPYQNNFIPNNALSAFDGQNSLGTWRLEICDLFPTADDGNFVRADLFLTQQPANFADLSVTKTVSNPAPANGAAINYTITATNAAASPNTANSVSLLDQLPLGVTFVSATGFGSYSNATGVWTIGSIPPGTTRTLIINVTVNVSGGTLVTNNAEIASSDQPDRDSTPANGSTAEDDFAAASFTVAGTRVAGTAPTLVCPAGSTLFDWATRTWTPGSLNNSYVISGVGSTNFALTTDFAFVTPSPTVNGTLTGGTVGEVGLFQNLNNITAAQVATSVMTLPTAVPGLQFRVFDIDFVANNYADRLTVTGSFNGAPVTPTLTNGISNYVVGNVAIGDAGAVDTSANGNVVITFASPVDTVTLRYGNHTTAPANPGNQYMSVHDITICNPVANLSVTKISNVVSDGISTTNPKAVSGALIRYCILVSNSGSGTANAMSVSDTMPANTSFIPGSIVTGANCNSAATPEDDDATGTDEADPYGVSFAGNVLTGTAASLAPSAGFAIAFNARIN